MTSAKLMKFGPFSPLPATNATYLFVLKIEFFCNPPFPFTADVICGWSLITTCSATPRTNPLLAVGFYSPSFHHRSHGAAVALLNLLCSQWVAMVFILSPDNRITRRSRRQRRWRRALPSGSIIERSVGRLSSFMCVRAKKQAWMGRMNQLPVGAI